jgi:hypothetical protein
MQMRFIDIPVGSIVFNPINGDLFTLTAQRTKGCHDERIIYWTTRFDFYKFSSVAKAWRTYGADDEMYMILWRP